VYIIGFPFAIRTTLNTATNNAGFPIPYVAKGVYAAEATENGVSIIAIDGMNNHGLSGAPVVYRDLNQGALVLKVAGVVSGFRTDAARVLRRLEEIDPKTVAPEDVANNRAVLQDGHWYRAEDAGESVNLNTGIVISDDISQAVDFVREQHLSG